MLHLVVVDHDAIVVIDGDEALIEGAVVEGVEQQAIRCRGLLSGGRCLPGFDVAGDQQCGKPQTGDATGAVVVLQ